jgi:hypothetical protein
VAVIVVLFFAAAVAGFFWHRHKKAQRARAYQDMERVTEMH